ncbi:acyltransferase family protein [Nocardioides nitrophenolicus]|uniref:acyltransferase family protein n=1 Tax=Nocardioides nitrophenolicus TaxID=60489 RepID=UPI00195E96DD|nr:acyltransferase [Nocardioides nitrophenolicus]MBM7515259.1 peptidoglycan/LPS O-acetylase OafA/YrhL [Nocardioides nitrophenolicus]
MSTTDEPAPQRFPVLDTLRAIGALAVLTTHVGFYAGTYTGHGWWGSLLSRLNVGVAIFFVLSGFLLARPYLARALQRQAPPATAHYLWKRFLRVYPVYVVAVVLTLVVALPDNADLGPRDWVVTLTMTNTFLDPALPAGLSQMWSLGVEVSFYLLLPVLMLLATGRRELRAGRVWLVVAAMTVLSGWWHLDGATRFGGLGDGPKLQWLPAFLGWFAVGIAFALLDVQRAAGVPSRLGRRLYALGAQPGVCWSLVLGLMLVATTPLAGPTLLLPETPVESLVRSLIYTVVGGLVVLTGIAAVPGSAYARVLSAPALRHLGLTSYSLFCLHLVLLDALAPRLGFGLFQGHGLVLWLLTVAVSLVAAELAYRLVERPAMRLKRLFPLRRLASTTAKETSGTSGR